MGTDAGNKLDAWMKDHGVSARELGRRLKTDKNNVRDWASGSGRPSFANAALLELATSFAKPDAVQLVDPVRVRDWYGDADPAVYKDLTGIIDAIEKRRLAAPDGPHAADNEAAYNRWFRAMQAFHRVPGAREAHEAMKRAEAAIDPKYLAETGRRIGRVVDLLQAFSSAHGRED